MKYTKRPRLPITKSMVISSQNGDEYTILISIVQTEDLDRYEPDGAKAVFKIFKLDSETKKNVLVVLIDNHRPYGFHNHNELPENHESRFLLEATDWQEAWQFFDLKLREIIK